MNGKSKPTLKDKKLRHNEYYGIQTVLDGLYQKATKGNSFNKLMPTITSDENILLAFRNIKGNKGSKTSACDNINIKDIERMNQSYFLNEVKRRFQNYQPQKVRRKEIPKPNGKTRPLLWEYQVCGIELSNNVFFKFWSLFAKRNFVIEVIDSVRTEVQNMP
ncbi:hypothetical protein BAC7755_56780 [Bacillus sp. MN7755]